MMTLTRKGEYAMRGMLYLAGLPESRIAFIAEIARATDVPVNFMAKIFQKFTKLGLVKSFRGVGGGFALARPAAGISMGEIVTAVEGPIMPNRCLSGKGACSRDRTCRVHVVWRRVQTAVVDILDSTTLADLAGTKRRAGSRKTNKAAG